MMDDGRFDDADDDISKPVSVQKVESAPKSVSLFKIIMYFWRLIMHLLALLGARCREIVQINSGKCFVHNRTQS